MLLRVLFLLTLLCTVCQADPYQSWADPSLEIAFRGTGLESGHVLDLSVRNKGAETVAFQLPQLTVLESNNGFAPVVVESSGGWHIPPGAEVSQPIIGYSLEQSLPGPARGRVTTYRPSTDSRYGNAQLALKKGLEYERDTGFKATILDQDKHKTMVLQRLIWTVYGSRNPKTPKALEQDLTRAFQRAGETVTANAVQALAVSVWSDVGRVYNTLK